ncbi:MAG: putative ABC transport system ATP-binding protein [Bradymonadia bacterium]|jgi:putative ABC transport system ATP-binding protein
MTVAPELLLAAARALDAPTSAQAQADVRAALADDPSLDRAARAAGLRLGQVDAEPLQLATLGASMLLETSVGWVAITGRRRGRLNVWLDDGAGVRLRRVPVKRVGETLGAIMAGYRLTSLAPIDAIGKEVSGGAPWARLRALVHIERRDIGVILMYSAAVGLTTLAIPVAVQTLVNTVAFTAVVQSLVVIGLALLSFLCLAGLLRILRFVATEYVQRRIFVRFALAITDRLTVLDPEIVGKKHLPEQVNRFFDALTVQKSAATLLIDGTELLLQTIIGLVLLAVYHPALAAFDLALIIGLVIIFGVLGRGAARTTVAESDAKYAVAAWLEDVATQPVLFRHPVAARQAVARADALAQVYLHTRQSHFRIILRQFTGGVTLQILANVCLLLIGGWLVMQGELTLGQLVAAELVVTLVVAGLAKLGKQLESLYDLLAGVTKLGKLIDLPVDAQRGTRLKGGATITLDGRPLADITAMREGPVARATVAACLGNRTESPVRINGELPCQIQRADLQATIQVISASMLVHGSVRENVRLGTARSPTEIDAVLDVFGFDSATRETVLLPNGYPLAPCEAVALTLARAVLARPQLLVIDGALDRLASDQRVRLIGALRSTRAAQATLLVTLRDDLDLPVWAPRRTA